jgi:hypothetical protein
MQIDDKGQDACCSTNRIGSNQGSDYFHRKFAMHRQEQPEAYIHYGEYLLELDPFRP